MAASQAPRPLRRVPLTVEIARVGTTLWHAARGGGRLLYEDRVIGADPARAAAELRRRVVDLGPTYVKLGQLVASSPGVFPEVVAEEFRSLLDRVPPAAPGAIEAVLAAELGRPPQQIFATFDPEPIASASIAQVHAATLPGGERVVVKVRRPGISERLAADVQILARLAVLLEWTEYGRIAGARDIVADFTANLNDELDFRTEAGAMTEWSNAMADTEFADKVRVPRVHWDYTTGKVLVMEHIDAIRIDDVDAVTAARHDGADLIRTILLSLLDSAFRRGVFHGDLHAGNVLVDPQGRVVLLDWGIVGRFDDDRRLILRRLVGDLVVHNDFDAATQGLMRLGAVGRPGRRKQAAADIRSFTAPLSGSELGRISYADFGKQLAELAKRYQVRLPRDLVLVGKQLLYVERYMKLLAPQWKPITDEQVVAFMAELLGQAEQEREGAEVAD
ncbi:ABC1 kinase family protein [Nocardia sp. NPDC059180]|uniref:ABC1 kinase family protein n=1 Tax=Nocardia sp. NPDC059180 TaxID=3346761 RepID=UPI003694CBC6